MNCGFSILDHPSDIGIEAHGETLSQVFEQAALGMMSIIVELSSVHSNEERKVTLVATDREHLLVRWLTEILYLYDGLQFVSKEFHLHDMNERSLTATILGEPLRTQKHHTLLDVKAITYHQLSIKEEDGKATVRVFLDI